MKHGDFSTLAESYSTSRPDYSRRIVSEVLEMCLQDPDQIEAVDVGAGTGIWTRMLFDAGIVNLTAIEPNNEMRSEGIRNTSDIPVSWTYGLAEATGRSDASADLLTMASAFHWTDFDDATKEFGRVLREGGLFVALWNPRLVDRNPVLHDIEVQVGRLLGDPPARISSGFSSFTEHLEDRLRSSPVFTEVSYLEDEHIVIFNQERYMTVWRSVNDLRVQLGELRFQELLRYIEKAISEMNEIKATYLTRAWLARKGHVS